ncbi:unnamed protein product [Oppiella nova]|uniref:Uncharacterized protein n=1 Tax=Oppiella nova TaxID=334625 RepID=A0A7R9MDZ4_9ACAR|nr:unnamed protein product [Oppiella nova]CAG2175477.1 unnamed protein product [Oppiella nova]
MDPLNTSIDEQSLKSCLDCLKVLRLLPKKSIDDNECNSLSIQTMGIKVLDRTRQTNGTNRCLGAKCTHICLPTKLDYRCVCSKNTNFETRGDHNHHYNCAIDWEYGSHS